MDSDRYLSIVDQASFHKCVQIVEFVPSTEPITMVLDNLSQTSLPILKAPSVLSHNSKDRIFDSMSTEISSLSSDLSQEETSDETLHIVSHSGSLASIKSLVSNVKRKFEVEYDQNNFSDSENVEIDIYNTETSSNTQTVNNVPETLLSWPFKIHGRWPIISNDSVIVHQTNIASRTSRIISASNTNLSVAQKIPSAEKDEVKVKGNQCTVALKAAFHIQLFDLQSKMKLKALKMTESIRYWKFLNDSTIVLISDFFVYHWDINSDDYPPKLFSVSEELHSSHIMNYLYDDQQQYSAIFAFNAFENKVIGHIQLYSFSYKISKVLLGFAGSFYHHSIPPTKSKKYSTKTKNDFTFFCYSNVTNGIISVERVLLNRNFFTTKSSNHSLPSLISKNLNVNNYLEEIEFKFGPTELELASTRLKDFPVGVYVFPNLSLLFLVRSLFYLILSIIIINLIYHNKYYGFRLSGKRKICFLQNFETKIPFIIILNNK